MKTERIIRDKLIHVGNIDNVSIVEHENKYYWIVAHWNTFYENLEQWEEIPKYLYDSLIKFQTELDSKTHTE